MSRHLVTASVDDLPELLEPEVELVEFDDGAPSACSAFAEALLEPGRFEAASFELEPGRPLACPGAVPTVLRETPGHAAWFDRLDWIADVFATLFDARRLGLRLAHLRRPMCPRFHVDRVPCRVITTFAGTGTEWIPEPEVDEVAFARRSDDPAREPAPLRPGGRIHELATGAVGFLKGGACEDARVRGVVHRSPPQDRPRLVLTLDLLA